jgi:hypothetical protein
VRALDRDNVGHVIALDDTDGTCDVLFVNDQGRSATRTMAWSELVVIDQPEPTALTEEAVATLRRIADDVERGFTGMGSGARFPRRRAGRRRPLPARSERRVRACGSPIAG